MKGTFGKLGVGLAGAVAAIGLISTGMQTANGQIVLTQTSPVETLGGMVNGKQTYDFTYYMDVGAAGESETLGSGAYVSLTLDGSLSELALVPSLTITNPNNSVTFGSPSDSSTDGVAYTWDYTGLSLNLTAVEPLGYITLVSDTQNALIPSDNVPPGNFETKTAANTDYVSEDAAVPNSHGIPLAALPLPPAVWPELLTLAGITVIGGLKMRRRLAKLQ
ncbi:MAG: hypothetical protein ACP5I8_16590 [Phycisphaerae bacterium]